MLDFAGRGAQTPPTAFAEEPAAPAAELEEEGNLPGVTLGADYTYEYDQGGNEDDDHCQYLHASVGLADVLLSPTLEAEWMLDSIHGPRRTSPRPSS